MKKNTQGQNFYSTIQANPVSAKPTMPVVGRQTIGMDRRHQDPSSVTRSDRYPIPGMEYRMRPE